MRCTILSLMVAAMAMAQPPQGEITLVPDARGVYYHAASGWIGLQVNPLMGFEAGSTRWLLGFGRGDAIAELPGPHAAVQTSTARPTFYLRGFPAHNGIYLVRAIQKQDYRQLRMSISRDFHDWATFRPQDLADVDLRSASGGLVTLVPRADLKPGDYAIVSPADPMVRGIKLGFDFEVAGPR